MKHIFIVTLFLLSMILPSKSTFAADNSSLMTAPSVVLQSSETSLRIVPSRAWTFDELRYQGKLLNNPGSFSGLVLNFGGPLFVGSGHNQGGAEKVLSVTLKVDGTLINQTKLLKGGTFSGKSIELVKISTLDTNDKVTPFSSTPLRSVIKVDDGVLRCEQFLTPSANVAIDKIYASMFSWTTQTNEWMAKTAKGEMRSGRFDRSWNLADDVQWTSIYNPDLQVAALTVFDKDSWNGAGVRHGYWNVEKRYHKQYYQPLAKTTLQRGKVYHWGVKVLFTDATRDKWKQKIQELVQQTSTETSAEDANLTALNKRFPPYQEGKTPRWEKEQAGIVALNPDTVLQPWTPVRATSKDVSVWNRSYGVGAWGLPQSVQIGGTNFLEAPITFTLKSGGKVLLPSAKMAEAHEGRADYIATAGDINAQTQYEYDGFVRTNFYFEKSTSLDQMVLRIPFKSENAQYFSYIAAVKGLQSLQTNSRSGAIPDGNGVVFKSTFQPQIWVGNHDAGLSWFSESDQFWNPVDSPNAIQIVRNGDNTELQIHFVTQKTVIPAGSSLSFGFMATPTKPRPADWRSWNFTTHQNTRLQDDSTPNSLRGNQVIFWHDAWRIMLMYPFPRDPQAFKNEVAALHKNGAKRVFPYIVANHITGTDRTYLSEGPKEWTTPEWTAFHERWQLEPNRTPTNFRRMSPATSFADWQLDALKQMIVDDGVDGAYVDEAYPYPDEVAAHGMGYAATDGTRRATYQLYAMRDYFKRMSYLFEKYGKGRPAIIAHASGVLAMPHLSFADIFVTGEQIYSKVQELPEGTVPSYLEMTPLDQWKAQFTGRQFGFVPLFLPEFRGRNNSAEVVAAKAPTREMLALALLNDVPVWPLWSNADEIYAVNQIKSDFDIGSKGTIYTPYWDVDAAKTNQKDTYISTYSNHNGILAIVSNLSDKSAQLTLNFSSITGGKVLLSAKNIQTNESYPVSNSSQVKVTVPRRDFILLRLR